MSKITKSFLLVVILIMGTTIAYQVFADVTAELSPISDGFYTAWTPSPAPTHFVNVDEASCNGVTDYNFTHIVGARDSYGVDLTTATSTIPDGSTITRIDISGCAAVNSATSTGDSFFSFFYRFNGTDSSDSGNYHVPSTFQTIPSGAWKGLSHIKTASSTFEIGAVLNSGSGPGIRLSRIFTVIEYCPPDQECP